MNTEKIEISAMMNKKDKIHTSNRRRFRLLLRLLIVLMPCSNIYRSEKKYDDSASIKFIIRPMHDGGGPVFTQFGSVTGCQQFHLA